MYMMIRISSTKLEKFDKRHARNVPCQCKDTHWFEFMKKIEVNKVNKIIFVILFIYHTLSIQYEK